MMSRAVCRSPDPRLVNRVLKNTLLGAAGTRRIVSPHGCGETECTADMRSLLRHL